MVTKKIVVMLCALVSLSAVFATDYAECYSLNDYFNKTPLVIHDKISDYEARLQSDKNDYYANLAIAILYTALSSPMENPEVGASQKIVNYSVQFEKKESNNSLAMTYYALGCSLVSRDSKNPIVQLMQVNKAIKTFDKAVTLAANQPIQWFVHYMRANFYINLPDTFKKRPVAESDFELVKRYYEGNPSIEAYMCNGYYNLGEIEKSRGNLEQAVKYWNLSVSINDKLALHSKEAAKASDRLALFVD